MTMEDFDEIDEIFKDGAEGGDQIPTNPDVIDDITPISDDIFGDNELNLDGETEKSILDEYLTHMGFTDGKLKIIDENDEESEVSFYDLTREEQLEILLPSQDSEESNEDFQLEDSEISLINTIRESNKSVEEYLEDYKKTILSELGVQEESYEIDSYDDQELFLLDLKNRWDLTDEELTKELEKELQDEPMFKKKVDALRKEYKELEDQYKQGQLQKQEEDRQEQYEKFSEKMISIAKNMTDFHGIEPEEDETNEVLSFILDQDESGTTEFYKTLSDPERMYEAAWFLRYGKESFDAIRDAYESEIQKLKKIDKTPVVYKKKDTGEKENTSIHDLI